MQVGADAVVDMAAPPPARAPGAAQANLNERSFDDHLDAAAPPSRGEPESPRLENADEDDALSQGDEPDGTLASAASAAAPPAQPALIQILASFAAATMAPDAETTPTSRNPESAPPTPTGADAAAPAPLAPHAVPPAQPKSTPGDKATAPMPAQSGREGTQHTSFSAENAQAAQATAQAHALPPVEGTATTQTAAPALLSALAPAAQATAQAHALPPADGTATTQTAAPALLSALAPPPPANGDARRTKIGDAAKISIAPANAGIADASAGAKPNAQGKVAPTPATSQTAPPRENFALLLAQHEAPQPASALPVPTSGLTAPHATPVSASTDSAGQIAPATVQVSREIVRRFNGENTRFELRLDPPELGRVEVRLEMSRDHRVTVMVGADSPQALAELSRHARDLEQALQSAGLELTENGLSFDLSDRSHNPDDARPTENRAARDDAEATAETSAAQRPARPLGLQSWRGVRVDLVA